MSDEKKLMACVDDTSNIFAKMFVYLMVYIADEAALLQEAVGARWDGIDDRRGRSSLVY